MQRELERPLAWGGLVVAVATLVALGVIDLQLRNAVSLQGVVSFELCAYSGSCRAIVEAWGPMGQIWAGLSLGLDYLFMPAQRIPAKVARSARFKVDQPVDVSAQDASVLVRAIGQPRLSVAQKLAAFDPDRHGGEVMASGRIGREVF